ncbi:MAG: adenylyl-sulfate kinase [Nannocystaceae bacterium]|nr:adenylyl-sulfate kinase [Nannocystaceae bacterium]
MQIVIVGHVDHGKSTLVGRLLADTGVLGDGKLEKVRATCERQGKVFEYAFLLDALEAEQDQGITIDAARVFFRTALRDYIIIDAPGHIEFLKNMVTGAARAEAAVLLIDAKEGVRENSRRHGYLLSMLGIRQVAVVVNKMDLVDFDRAHFDGIAAEYRAFLADVGIRPAHVIPMAARSGDNVATRSNATPWYDGPTVLEAVDGFAKLPSRASAALRMPVQDVYKWGHRGDDARVIAGRVESGTLRVGDRVLFSPSNKTATVASIERWAAPEEQSVEAGRSIGVTLDQQIYVERGEVLSHLQDAPEVGTRLRVNLFWLGKRPMERGRAYKLKLGTAATEVRLHEIHRVLDASDLQARIDKPQVDRHDVADVVLVTRHTIAFDRSADNEITGRFVIVDGYDIAGGGIVRELVPDEHHDLRMQSRLRDIEWVRGDITPGQRAELNGHPATLVMLTGEHGVGKHAVARALEAHLVKRGHHAYLLDGKNVFLGVDADLALDDRDELVRRFGEVAHLLLDAGLLVISTTNVIGLADHRVIETLVAPRPVFTVHLGAPVPGDAPGLNYPAGTAVEGTVEGIVEELRRRGRLRRDA